MQRRNACRLFRILYKLHSDDDGAFCSQTAFFLCTLARSVGARDGKVAWCAKLCFGGEVVESVWTRKSFGSELSARRCAADCACVARPYWAAHSASQSAGVNRRSFPCSSCVWLLQNRNGLRFRRWLDIRGRRQDTTLWVSTWTSTTRCVRALPRVLYGGITWAGGRAWSEQIMWPRSCAADTATRRKHRTIVSKRTTIYIYLILSSVWSTFIPFYYYCRRFYLQKKLQTLDLTFYSIRVEGQGSLIAYIHND